LEILRELALAQRQRRELLVARLDLATDPAERALALAELDLRLVVADARRVELLVRAHRPLDVDRERLAPEEDLRRRLALLAGRHEHVAAQALAPLGELGDAPREALERAAIALRALLGLRR